MVFSDSKSFLLKLCILVEKIYNVMISSFLVRPIYQRNFGEIVDFCRILVSLKVERLRVKLLDLGEISC